MARKPKPVEGARFCVGDRVTFRDYRRDGGMIVGEVVEIRERCIVPGDYTAHGRKVVDQSRVTEMHHLYVVREAGADKIKPREHLTFGTPGVVELVLMDAA